MLISRHALSDYLARPLESFLWMKGLSREQVLREVNQLSPRPVFKTDPWLHQLVCFYIGACRPEFIFHLDMGLGKSKIILDLFTQALREGTSGRMLVTVPRRINLFSWEEAVAAHSDLEPHLVSCEDIDEKWRRLSEPKGDLTVIDLQGLHWALTKKVKGRLVIDEARVTKVQRAYDFISLDECHKLANPDSLWFQLARRLTQTSRHTFGITGTMFGKKVEQVWPQFYLVDRGDTFGETRGLFRAAFFDSKPNQFGRGVKYAYRRQMDEKLHAMMQNRSLRYEDHEVNDLPKMVPRVEKFSMTGEQREHYTRALEGFINSGGGLEECKAQWLRMRQISSGYLAWKDEHGDHVLRFKDNPKLDGLERLIDEAVGYTKVVVAYDYTETGRMICDRVKEMGLGFEWFYGGTKDQEASRRRFMEDPDCRVFVMNSEAGGAGNDGLQLVARYLFFYETPTPPITRRQTLKRIHRPGQQHRTFAYDLVMRKSLDGGILAQLAENLDTFESVTTGRRRPPKSFFLTD